MFVRNGCPWPGWRTWPYVFGELQEKERFLARPEAWGRGKEDLARMQNGRRVNEHPSIFADRSSGATIRGGRGGGGALSSGEEAVA